MSPRREDRGAIEAAPGSWLDLAGIAADLEADLARLGGLLDATDTDLSGLRRARFADGGDDTEVSAGTFEAEHESTIAWNTRQTLRQTRRALARIQAGTYGTCETCQNQIDPRRLDAFPRATLCLTCQQAHHRHPG